jgi:hypothetical protein
MSLSTLFRRRPPVPAPPTITRHDAEVARAWGLSWPQWEDLTDQGRAMLRHDLTHAPHFYQDGRP